MRSFEIQRPSGATYAEGFMDSEGSAYFTRIGEDHVIWLPDDFMKHLLIGGGDIEFGGTPIPTALDMAAISMEVYPLPSLDVLKEKIVEAYPYAMIHALGKGKAGPGFLELMYFARVSNFLADRFRRALEILREDGILMELYISEDLYYPKNAFYSKIEWYRALASGLTQKVLEDFDKCQDSK